VHRGEIRWYTFAAPDKRRPVLLLSRELVVERLNEFIVVPARVQSAEFRRKWFSPTTTGCLSLVH
jgi:mRNA-degrading endonuclease toxin of MazEF toxin-antitoxin module